MIARYGLPPERGRRYIVRPGAYAILARQGQLLMTYQAEPAPEIQLPGGGIDSGETPVQALFREAQEETGWTLSHPRHLTTYRRYVFMPEYDMWAEKICHIFLAHPARRVSAPTEDGHTALWLQVDEALNVLVSPGDAIALQRAMRLNLIR